MALTKYTLGDLIGRNKETNFDLKYGVEDVRGVLNTKGISSTKVNVEDRDLSKFLVVKPGGFIFNHRVHDKLGLGYNTSCDTYIFTNDYVSFYIKPEIKETVILPDYLYIWFLRPEFDRYMLFKTYGSATLFFNWDNMCELEIKLPDIGVQRKCVAIYKAMVANQQSYERGLEDLKLVCDGYIEDLRKKMPCKKIGDYILEQNNRNNDLSITNVQGVNSSSRFDETKANTNGLDFKNYKIVQTGDFAYNPSRINLGSIALLRNENCIVSPMYIVFRMIDVNQLLPEYLMLWFERKEFQRSTLFYATGSVRDTFTFDLMKEVRIPIPDIEVQKAIANIYKAYITRKQINEQLKEQIKNICPILIKGSLEESNESNY